MVTAFFRFNALQRANLFRKGTKWLFGKNGMLKAASQEYRDWFKPDFHPDNYPMIENYPAWLAVNNETQDPIAAGHALWEAAA